MKRFANISRALLVCCFLAFVSMETMAQVVKLRVAPMSPGKLAAIGKSSALATTGLKVFGKGAKTFLLADTTGSGATVVTSFTWSFVSRPTASNAVFDSTGSNQYQSFTADSGGQYIVSVSINGGASDQDTFWVSTYIGNPTTAVSCNSVRDMPFGKQYRMANYGSCSYLYARDYGTTGSQYIRPRRIFYELLEMPHHRI